MRAYNYVLLYVETVSRLKDYVREFECKSVFSFAVHTCVSESVCYVLLYATVGHPCFCFCCCCVCCWWCAAVVVVVVLVVFNNIALAEFINLVFTRMPGASYRRRFKPLFVQRLSSAIN